MSSALPLLTPAANHRSTRRAESLPPRVRLAREVSVCSASEPLSGVSSARAFRRASYDAVSEPKFDGSSNFHPLISNLWETPGRFQCGFQVSGATPRTRESFCSTQTANAAFRWVQRALDSFLSRNVHGHRAARRNERPPVSSVAAAHVAAATRLRRQRSVERSCSHAWFQQPRSPHWRARCRSRCFRSVDDRELATELDETQLRFNPYPCGVVSI